MNRTHYEKMLYNLGEVCETLRVKRENALRADDRVTYWAVEDLLARLKKLTEDITKEMCSGRK